MKRKSGRITRAISVLLTLAMLLTLLPTVAFAADEPVAQYGDQEYTTLSEALTAAQAGGGGTVRLLRDYTLEEDVTVPSGVTLLVPFSAEDTSGHAEGTSSDSTRVSWVNESTYLYDTLTIPEGKTLTVAGTLIVGGVQHHPSVSSQGHTSGAYSQVICNGTLEVNGALTVYGLIKGAGTTQLNASGTLSMPFLINDFSGGTNAKNLYNAGTFPFGQYATVNLQCKFVMQGGAALKGLASLYINTLKSIMTQTVDVIGATTGLIHLPVGSTLTAVYDGSNCVNQTVGDINLSDFGKVKLEISGGASGGSFSIKYGFSTFGSSGKYLNIPYNYDVTLTNGTYQLDCDCRIMPGAAITVAEDAALNVTGGLLVTDGWIQNAKNGKQYPSSAVLKQYGFSQSGNLIVNGTLQVAEKATFGGIVQTTQPENAKLEIMSGASLTNTGLQSGEIGSGSYSNNLVTYDLPARLRIGQELVPLAAGTYYGDTADAWVLPNYTMTYYTVAGDGNTGTTETVTINQQMHGTWMDTAEHDLRAEVAAYRQTHAAALALTQETVTKDDLAALNAALSAYDALSAAAQERLAETQVALIAVRAAITFTVTFDGNGSSQITTGTAKYETPVAQPTEAPTRAGYTFAGWYADAACTKEYDFSAPVTGDLTLYAKWTANTYTVTFDAGEGTVTPNEKQVTFDQPYGDLPTPTRTGYIFGGWWWGETQITKDSFVQVDSNHTVQARWTESENTHYSVIHIGQDLSGEYTVILRQETLSGKTNSTAYATAKDFDGFTYNNLLSTATGNIHADGTLTLTLYYTRNQYTVTYYDGDTQVGEQETHLYGETLTAREYSKAGYDFVGWYTDNTLTQPYEFKTMPAENLALYAKLEALPYTVTYMDDKTKLDEQTVYCGNSFVPLTPTKTGYTFAGWCTDPELTAAYTSAPMPAEDLTLYAKWEINTYTVTFRYVDENGNPIQPDTTQSVQYQGAATVPSTAIAGYRFSRADGATQNITENTTVTLYYVSYLTLLDNYVSSTDFDASNRTHVVTAEGYYQNLITVQREQYREMGSYNTFLPAVQALAKADLETDIAEKVPPTNDLLADPEYVGADGAVANLTQPEADVVYVDMLRPDFLAVNMLGIPFLTTLFDNEEITGIAINEKSVDNYKDQFSLMYAVAEATIDVPEEYDGDLTQYLMAQKDTLPIRVLDGKYVTAKVTGTTLGDVTYDTTYVIHFFNHEHELHIAYNLPDGTQAADSKTLTLGYGDPYEVPSPEVTGYTAEAATGTMGIADTVVTVTYQPEAYTVTLDPNGGTLDGEKTLTVRYGEAYGTLPEPTKAGYVFTGWYDAAGSHVNESTKYETASDTTLTAHWSVSAYTITYVVDGVTVKTERYDFGAAIAPYTYTKEGYTISAWSPAVPATMPAKNLTVSATSTVNTYTVTYQVNGETVHTVQYAYGAEIEPYSYELTGYTVGAWNETVPATMPARDLTFTANATVNTYTVTYVVDGQETHRDSVPYGAAIPAYTYSKTGYTFSGWDATLPETMPAQNLTLNGTTTVNAYTITFDSNGGSAVSSVTADYGTPLTQPDNPTRTGYTFRGWYTDTALTEAFLFTTMPAESVMLYAKWEANTYTLHFDSAGGSAVEDRTVTYGQPYGALPTPEMQGYTFTGWQMADGTAVNANLTVTQTEDHTVYAVWTPKGDTPYTVCHYQQTISGDYVQTESEQRTSATGAEVTAVAKSYEGFTYDAEHSNATGTVTADGGLVLRLYYTRNHYTVTWVVDGNETSEDYLFGATPEFTGSTDKAGDATHEFRFTGWSPAVATVTGDATYAAQYYEYYEAVIGEQSYLRLTDALAAAQNGDTVVLHEDVTLAESAVVPADVLLLIPCMDNDVGYDPATGYCPDGTSTAGKTGRGPAAACYRKLTVAGDATLTVEGTVLVNAVTGRPAAGHYDQDVTGGYGEIALDGSILVRSGGTLDVCGYLNGTGSVTAERGSKVCDLYVVRNWRGGQQAFECYQNDLYPMNEYDCHNITVPLIIRSGATYSGTVKMFANGGNGGQYYYTRFPQVDNDNGLIRLTGDDGYAVKTFENGREIYTIYGGATFERSTLKIVGVLLTTGEFVYPIDGDISLRLHDGTYTFVDRYKFLTGAEVTAENANVTIPEGNLVVFYDEFHDVQNTDNTQYPERPAATLTLGNGGSLTVNGTLAGDVYAQDGVGAITKGEHAAFLAITKEANGYTNGTRELRFAAEFLREGYTPRWVGNTLVWVSADFTEVDAAIEAVPEDLSIYSDESVAKLHAAIDAVDYAQPEQTVVDGYAAAIRAAIDGLTYRTYTITWDVDGVQTTTQVPYGTVPTYDGTPVKEGDAQYSYTFHAWEPAPSAATADVTYTAQFTAKVNRYTATFVDADGNTVKAQNVEYGNTVTAPTLPARDGLQLSGWASEKNASAVQYAPGSAVPVTGACTFYPVWHVHSYTATVTAPTVGHGGYTTYICDCGDSYVAEPTDPLPDLSDRFSDVPQNWAYPGIAYCVEHGLMAGVGGGRFDPNGATTRAMIVTILWRQAGEPAATKASPFTDLTQDWYKAAVAWAAETGVVNGRDAVTFDPDSAITRQEMAAMLCRYAQHRGFDTSKTAELSGFPDSGEVSAYARTAMAWANASGLIMGDNVGGVDYLDPLGSAIRAQAAVILMRFCESVGK